jgi:hypothetical protein
MFCLSPFASLDPPACHDRRINAASEDVEKTWPVTKEHFHNSLLPAWLAQPPSRTHEEFD